jgi:hypothetical protein
VPLRGGLAPQILVGLFFKGPQKKQGQKGQLEVQNSSADEKKYKTKTKKVILGGARGMFSTSLYGQSAPDATEDFLIILMEKNKKNTKNF